VNQTPRRTSERSGRFASPARLGLILVCLLALAAPMTAAAGDDAHSIVERDLLQAARADHDAVFDVIVQGSLSGGAVEQELQAAKSGFAPVVGQSFVTVPGVAVALTGSQVLSLTRGPEPLIITRDEPVAPAGAPANLEPPAVTGTAVDGAELTAGEGTWATGDLSFSFRWLRCGANGAGCSPIDGETARTYTVGAADAGSTLRVAVVASGVDGSARARSLPTDVVPGDTPDGAKPRKMKAPRIGGRARFGSRLSAATGAWTGAGTPEFAYQWQRCGIDQRTEAMLRDGPEDYVVPAAAPGETAISPDALASSFTFEAWVVPDGQRGERRNLVAAWLPGDARRWAPGQLEPVALYLDSKGHYGLNVGGQDGVTVRTSARPLPGSLEHVVGTWDGADLRLFRDGSELGSRELSGSLGEGASGVEVDASLVAEAAVYRRALQPWEVRGHEAGCLDIVGASGQSYQAGAGDLGRRLRVEVTGTSDNDSVVDASGLTPDVAIEPPNELSSPAILGTAEQGQVLSAAHGAWDAAGPLDFSYRWQTCREGTCADVGGGPTYRPGAGDVGSTIRVAVTASGAVGETTAVSDDSEVVTALPAQRTDFKQHWPYVAGLSSLTPQTAAFDSRPPTIAIVDSGIDTSRPEFAGRVVEQVDLASRQPNSPGDGYGHGTAVAGVAASRLAGHSGAAPYAKLVSIDVLDDTGVANTRDVIAAADWIYANRQRLNIRVANFSLHGTSLASLVSDPLDKAVERLWLSGIVVVAAAGNYAVDGKESYVPFAPANDPFVLTVGATDTMGSYTVRDDAPAPWSAWGYTRDGFSKPELAAPGRYIAAPVPAGSRLTQDRPDRIVEPGYLQLSGTSLSAPVVAGAAADLLGLHPDWTPDQVKGALMLTASPLRHAKPRSLGVGSVNASAAAAVAAPPNPNLALRRFVVPDPRGGSTPVFDSSWWTNVAASDPAWASVAWGSVAWGSAAWSSVAWGSVAWGSVAWGSVAWGSVAWGSVAWGSGAANDFRADGPYELHEN
jgi:serine protease AprX